MTRAYLLRETLTGFQNLAHVDGIDSLRAAARLLADPGEKLVWSGFGMAGVLEGPDFLLDVWKGNRERIPEEFRKP